MGMYPALSLTAAGRTLYTKMVNNAGGSLTGVAIGDGAPAAPVNIDNLTALAHSRFVLPIDSSDADNVNSILYLTCHKSNADILVGTDPTGMAIKEIGLLAHDPDVGDILYAYCCQSTAGQYDILPPSSYGSVTWRWKLGMLIDNPGVVGLPVSADTYQALRVDINGANGYSQLRLRQSYTPTGAADPHGQVGDVAWDSSYFYLKTASGWRRAALASF